MRILLLTPGTGHFFCGSCLRDHALGRALAAAGHEVDQVPLYLPMVLEGAEPSAPVRLGGINCYLAEKAPWLARRLPRSVRRWFDAPGLLRMAARRGGMTEAKDLGAMTLSMARGEHGRQAGEIEQLVRWVRDVEHPDVVVLSNALLLGLARRLREALDRPVVVTLQGEAPFVDGLPPEYRDAVWAELAARAVEVERRIAVSDWYAGVMAERLRVPRASIDVVPNGIDLAPFREPPRPWAERRPRTIGYLARMCRDKGLDVLVGAFARLRQRPGHDDVRLRVAGVQLAEDRPFVDGLQQSLRDRGLDAAVEFLPNLARADKLAFLQTLSVLSVPAFYGESFGLYLLEAMAAGVPVVQPDVAAFGEIVAATGGGITVPAADPRHREQALADGLAALLDPDGPAAACAAAGRRAVFERFSAARMAADVERILLDIAAPVSAPLAAPAR